MNIIKYKHIFFALTAILVVAAIVLISYVGLPLGIDFTGGSLMEVRYDGERPAKELVETEIEELALGGFSVRETGDTGYIVRTRDLSEGEHGQVLSALSIEDAYAPEEVRFSSIGPTIGEELRSKAVVAIVIVLLVIILFVAFAFREVSKPVSSWRYGGIAIIALIHDILIPAGAYAAYSYYTGAEVDTLFVMAILAILGYSVNDTIIIFDRVRENLKHNIEFRVKEDFAATVGKSLSQTYARSINTSITTLLVLITLFYIGGVTTQAFAFVLMVGVLAGTYSSLCLAAPLLVAWQAKQK